MENGNDFSSSLSFASSSYLSNGSSNHSFPSTSGSEPGTNINLLSLSKLSGSLENLLLDPEYDYSDVDIVVEGISIGVNRCILATRSRFFHELFKKGKDDPWKEGKPKYQISELVPHGRIGYEAFMVFLNYLYTGKLKPSPTEVATCVDDSCAHDACRPAIDYAVELMYASATFQMKELVMLVQRHLLNFVDKAYIEDVIPIIAVAFHCKLTQLCSHCVQIVSRSDLEDIFLEKELPHEVLDEVKSLRRKYQKESGHVVEVDSISEKRIKRIYKALDSDDVDLLKLLLAESDITLDHAYALHYAAAYCNPKVVNKVLDLDMADSNLRNPRGHTVLHVAARRKDSSIILGLLNHNASVLDATLDGQTAVKICRRLTRPKDYNETPKEGFETNKDRLCIDVLERGMQINPIPQNMSMSLEMAADDLHMMLLFYENRVAMARTLFPHEARLAMEQAQADSTSEYTGHPACKGTLANWKEVDLNELPSEQVKKLLERLKALQKTVENGRRYFPNCSVVLDKLLEDDVLESLLLERGTPEEQRNKRTRYMELKDDVKKAFDKDVAGLSSSSSSSSLPKISAGHKVRRR